MSTKAVVGWLVVAIVLGLGVVLALRGGGEAAGLAKGSRVLNFSPSAVRKITIGPAGAGSLPDVLERSESSNGEWMLRLGGPNAPATAWPVPGAQADNILVLMNETLAIAVPQPGSSLGDMPTEMVLERADGGPITIRLAERTIGGMGLIEVTTRGDGPGETTTRAVVNDQLHQMLRDRSVRNWRDRTVMPWAKGDVSRVRLEGTNKVLGLGRIEGRWSLREPLAAPADQAAVQTMLATLAGAEVAEFVDDGAPGIPTGVDRPKSKVLIETDRNDVSAATDRPSVNTIRHTLDIGGHADGTGEKAFALIDGERLVKISTVSLSRLTLDPAAYLAPHPTAVKASQVGMIVLERLDQAGIPTDDGRILKRSLDRWVDLTAGEPAKALPDEEVKDISAALAFLTGDTANAQRPEVRLDAPEAYRAGARISLRSLDDAPLAEVEVGMSSVSALAAVRSGNVYRVYALDRLPRLVARVMQASPAINPPAKGEVPPEQNK